MNRKHPLFSQPSSHSPNNALYEQFLVYYSRKFCTKTSIFKYISPQLDSPHTHNPTEASHSSPSPNTEAQCPLFNCFIAAYSYRLYTIYWVLPSSWTFWLFQFLAIMNDVFILPLPWHSCTQKTIRWILESRIVESMYIQCAYIRFC